jgi:hypothetical protein
MYFEPYQVAFLTDERNWIIDIKLYIKNEAVCQIAAAAVQNVIW